MKFQQTQTNLIAMRHPCGALRVFSACVMVTGLLLCGDNRVMAATNNWILNSGSSSGDWFNSANWSPAGVPTGSDDVVVTTNSTAVIGVEEGAPEANVNSLTINRNGGGVTVGDTYSGTLNVAGKISVTAGTLTLNYGTISANTIVIGSGGSYSDSSAGVLNLTGANAGWALALGVTAVVNSEIMGTNGLLKGGLGTLVLAGNNTYSGGTTISIGTLQVGNGGTSGNLGEGNVTNNGTLTFNRNDEGDNFVVTNQISGTGKLTQNGGGKTILTGDNTYSGGTIISNGTLQVGNGGTTGSLGSGNITNYANLIYNLSTDVLLTNRISGTGNFTQAGSNTVTFTGNNTYKGTTTIQTNSALQVGNGGTSGTLGGGNVIDDGVLIFNRSDSLTVSNQISGVGNLVQEGTGTTILTANNTYSGTTTISNGTLQVGNGGGTGSLGTSNVYNYGTLVFNRTNSLMVSNTISGTGSLVQGGKGTNSVLFLYGTNTYSGGTTISNGSVIVVGNGHALGNGDVNVSDGTLKAGPTSATNKVIIYVGSNYVQSASGTLVLTIGGTNSSATTNEYDQLVVAGTASLDGELWLIQTNGYRPQHLDQFTLVTASNGVTGTFANGTDSTTNWTYSPLLDPTLIYNGTNVIMEFTNLSFLTFLANSNVVLTSNQTAVARALDSISTSTASNDIALINFLDYAYSTNSSELTNNLPKAFNEISPDQLTSMQVAAFLNMDMVANQFQNRAKELRSDYRARYSAAWRRYAVSTNMFDAFVDKPWDWYGELPVNYAKLKGDKNANGYNITGAGLTVGADHRVNDHLYAGAAVGYLGSSAGLDRGGSMEMDTFNLQAYATWFNQGWYFEGMVGGNFNGYKTTRSVLGTNASGTTYGLGWTGLVGGGYDWEVNSWKLGPHLNVQYSVVNINSFTEGGSLAPLTILSQNVDALHAELGMDFSYYYLRGRWNYITPSFSLAWRHDFIDPQPSLDAKFASGAGEVFTVDGPKMGRDSAIASAGLSVQWKPSFNTFVNLMAQVGRDGYSAGNLNLGLRYSF